MQGEGQGCLSTGGGGISLPQLKYSWHITLYRLKLPSFVSPVQSVKQLQGDIIPIIFDVIAAP